MKDDQLYKDSGVDIDLADSLVDWLKKDESGAKIPLGEVVSGVGGFAALFRPNFKGIADPLLVTGTDGVGTKVLLGSESGHLEGLGQDLVGMCVNDLYTLGARPLWFLDYYATGKLDSTQFKSVLSGIQKSVKHCGALLLGGETAEMPGLYGKGHFDLAGFVVGVVDGQKMLGPKNVKEGDSLVAFAASGFHSNGFSLIRKWLIEKRGSPSLIKNLMTPTRLYSEVPDLLDQVGTEVFHALANITGGGISGNLPRVLPSWAHAKISLKALPTPPWMRDFMETHGSSIQSLESVFNLGCGMIAVVDSKHCEPFISKATALGIPCQVIGHLEKDETQKEATVTFW